MAREEAASHLETVRAAVESSSFAVRSWNRPKRKPSEARSKKNVRGDLARRLSVTVSIGMADTTGKDALPESVLKKADRALYRAKKQGRNRLST